MRKLSLLGATGSIGTQALDIVAQHPGEVEVVALASGGANLQLALEQAERFRPAFLAFAHADADEVRSALTQRGLTHIEVGIGPSALKEAAARAGEDGVVLNGINGGVGLEPTLVALQTGSQLALANKESLVVGAPVVRAACVRPGQLTPVDSEHSAIAQCLASGRH